MCSNPVHRGDSHQCHQTWLRKRTTVIEREETHPRVRSWQSRSHRSSYFGHRSRMYFALKYIRNLDILLGAVCSLNQSRAGFVHPLDVKRLPTGNDLSVGHHQFSKKSDRRYPKSKRRSSHIRKSVSVKTPTFTPASTTPTP